MSIHHFHCTDGVDLVVDRQGSDTPAYSDMIARAERVAFALMRAVPDYDEWADWAVHVYDAHGQVAIVPFASVPAELPDEEAAAFPIREAA
jgi:hypothetical protein